MPRKWMPRVAIKIDGKITVHLPNASGDYDTMCGIDSNDPKIGHHGTVPVAVNTLIDCSACKNMWELASKYRPSDFK